MQIILQIDARYALKTLCYNFFFILVALLYTNSLVSNDFYDFKRLLHPLDYISSNIKFQVHLNYVEGYINLNKKLLSPP